MLLRWWRLRSLLHPQSDQHRVRTLVSALGDLPWFLSKLSEALYSDDVTARNAVAAIDALSRLAEENGCGAKFDREKVDWFKVSILQADYHRAACLGGKRVLPILSSALADTHDPQILLSLAEALVALGPSEETVRLVATAACKSLANGSSLVMEFLISAGGVHALEWFPPDFCQSQEVQAKACQSMIEEGWRDPKSCSPNAYSPRADKRFPEVTNAVVKKLLSADPIQARAYFSAYLEGPWRDDQTAPGRYWKLLDKLFPAGQLSINRRLQEFAQEELRRLEQMSPGQEPRVSAVNADSKICRTIVYLAQTEAGSALSNRLDAIKSAEDERNAMNVRLAEEALSKSLTSIHDAVERGTISDLHKFCNAKNVNRLDKYGRKPIYLAVGRGSAERVTLLLQKGSHTSTCEDGESLLTTTLNANFRRTNGEIASGRPPKSIIKNDDIENIVQLALKHGCKPENDDLIMAVTWCTESVVRLLLDGGADPSAKSSKGGRSALEWAKIEGKLSLAELLLSRMPNDTTDVNGT